VTQKRRGRTRNRSKSSLKAREIDQIQRKYQQGESAASIAEHLGVTNYDVLAILKKFGVKVRTSRDARSRPVAGNSFLDSHPMESRLWDAERNLGATPSDVKRGSAKKFWWRCLDNKDHVWQQSVSVVASGHGCPFCSGNRFSHDLSLAVNHPDVAQLFDESRNQINSNQVTANSTRSYWWRGGCGHKWESTPNRMVTAKKRSRARPHLSDDARKDSRGCPFCGGKAVWPGESFADLFPARAKLWHPIRNGDLTPSGISAFSMKRVWWLCNRYHSHEWEGSVAVHAKSHDCPFCQNLRLDPKTNSLLLTHPILAKQWHPTKNHSLTPRDITPGYSKQIWWKCAKGSDHIWKQKPSLRVGLGIGCPFCSGMRLSKTNSLAAEKPRLAKQWIRSRNRPLRPEMVRQNDKRYVWWQCPVDSRHQYRARITQRANNRAECPFCTLAPRSKAEIYLEFELRQFFDIDSDGSVIRIGEKNLRCDIVLKSHKIVIEFDGSYWHKELQTRDEEKTRLLTKAGWQVIRVREEPLGATSSLDVIVPQQSIKKTADAVIRHLLQLGVQPLVSPNKYLKMGKSTNEDQANQYITQRLKKRAVRRARESQSRNR